MQPQEFSTFTPEAKIVNYANINKSEESSSDLHFEYSIIVLPFGCSFVSVERFTNAAPQHLHREHQPILSVSIIKPTLFHAFNGGKPINPSCESEPRNRHPNPTFIACGHSFTQLLPKASVLKPIISPVSSAFNHSCNHSTSSFLL